MWCCYVKGQSEPRVWCLIWMPKDGGAYRKAGHMQGMVLEVIKQILTQIDQSFFQVLLPLHNLNRFRCPFRRIGVLIPMFSFTSVSEITTDSYQYVLKITISSLPNPRFSSLYNIINQAAQIQQISTESDSGAVWYAEKIYTASYKNLFVFLQSTGPIIGIC